MVNHDSAQGPECIFPILPDVNFGEPTEDISDIARQVVDGFSSGKRHRRLKDWKAVPTEPGQEVMFRDKWNPEHSLTVRSAGIVDCTIVSLGASYDTQERTRVTLDPMQPFIEQSTRPVSHELGKYVPVKGSDWVIQTAGALNPACHDELGSMLRKLRDAL